MLDEPESKEDISRLLHDTNQAMNAELSRADGLVIVDGEFQEIKETPPSQAFEAAFSEAPRPIKFRFRLETHKGAEPIAGRLRLRILGKIVHQMGEGEYIDIFPIAIF